MSDIDMEQYLFIERGSPELFRGSKEADVLFLGQDPTISKSETYTSCVGS